VAPVAPVTDAPVTDAPVAPATDAPVTNTPVAPVVVTDAQAPTFAPRRLMSYDEACLRTPALCKQLDDRWKSFGGRKAWEEANPFYNENMTPKDAKQATFIAGAVFAVLGFVFLCVLCCCHSTIDTCCRVVGASTDAIFAMPGMLFMPAIELIFKFAMFSSLLFGLTFLVTAGEMDTKTYASVGGQEVNGLRRHFKYDDQQKGMLAYYIFGIFWLMEFGNSLGAFIVSYAVVGWYYTPKQPNGYKGHNVFGLLWGYIYAVTFHCGTLACGSLLIAIFRFLRMIFSAVAHAGEAEGNPAMKCIAMILICCVKCFEKFFRFISKNAYIDVCITSDNFCGAAHNVMEFLAKQGKSIMMLHGICVFFSIAGVVGISSAVTKITYELITRVDRWKSDTSPQHIESPGFVAICTFIGAAFVSTSFMVIFDHTADTLLYVYCWNKAHGNNTVGKYAPDSLLTLVEHQDAVKENSKSAHAPAAGGGGFFSTFGFGQHETAPLINKGGGARH